jgi:hypothetical protein
LHVDVGKERQIMTDIDLFAQTENQISLFQSLVKSYKKDIQSDPTGKYAIQTRITINHCHDTLLRLNDLLVRPFEEIKES